MRNEELDLLSWAVTKEVMGYDGFYPFATDPTLTELIPKAFTDSGNYRFRIEFMGDRWICSIWNQTKRYEVTREGDSLAEAVSRAALIMRREA
jgi:hypothetical protein